MLTGKVFDIRRFSTHDGDGIRTTVFLKGCPLHCVWCQNPEGISPDPHLFHFQGRCVRCGLCAQAVPNIHIQDDGYPDIHAVRPEDYSTIIDVCPASALNMDCRILSVSEVMDEVCRDKVFFAHGGGVTFSGGEPFAQFSFLIELLKESKKRGLHTAVETSLYTARENIVQALLLIDLMYADLKVLNDVEHKRMTGVSNRVILDNMEFILRHKPHDQVVVRTPLIPRLTAYVDNIRDTAAYLAKLCPETRYELLNYNPLAVAKYTHIDFPYCFKDNPPSFTKEEMTDLTQVAAGAGLKNIII